MGRSEGVRYGEERFGLPSPKTTPFICPSSILGEAVLVAFGVVAPLIQAGEDMTCMTSGDERLWRRCFEALLNDVRRMVGIVSEAEEGVEVVNRTSRQGGRSKVGR